MSLVPRKKRAWGKRGKELVPRDGTLKGTGLRKRKKCQEKKEDEDLEDEGNMLKSMPEDAHRP